MKILFPYMARWFAVNWTRYHSLLEVLGQQGHEVHVLQPPSMDSEETNFREIAHREMPNVHLHDVELREGFWNKKLPLDKLVKKAYFSMAAYKDAKKIVAEEGIDLVLLYNIPQYQFMRLKGPKIVFDFADDYIDMLAYELGSLNIAPIRGVAQKMLDSMMKRSDAVLCVSHELAKLAKGNVHVLANGVSGDQMVALVDGKPSNVVATEKFTVGFLGAFEYFIDFDIILDAAEKLPEVHFLLVGSGRDWEGVKQAVADRQLNNIELTGGVPHDEVFDYIDRMDVCLNIFKPIPVSHRACPIKLFEYLSRHKPVISTRLHEMPYIDDADFLYYADEPEELVLAIERIQQNPEEAFEMAHKGYNKVDERFTWEKLATQFLELSTVKN
ncbi:MAG: glycosyltransferase family 4 protein [Gammaproteobacteria bacterium]|nr:glycosyltransferase family 4 protein [Gammaproteobacteria bacterium]